MEWSWLKMRGRTQKSLSSFTDILSSLPSSPFPPDFIPLPPSPLPFPSLFFPPILPRAACPSISPFPSLPHDPARRSGGAQSPADKRFLANLEHKIKHQTTNIITGFLISQLSKVGINWSTLIYMRPSEISENAIISLVDEDFCNKFGRKMQHDHSQMITWPKNWNRQLIHATSSNEYREQKCVVLRDYKRYLINQTWCGALISTTRFSACFMSVNS